MKKSKRNESPPPEVRAEFKRQLDEYMDEWGKALRAALLHDEPKKSPARRKQRKQKRKLATE